MPDLKRVDLWKIIAVVILILAVVSRFYMLGERAVSHDETTHAKYSWNFYAGKGFQHDPLMHGTLLFEATALFYFLFGVSDFTARLYAALAGIALVIAPLLFHRWLGRRGALLASFMVLISPAITYYSRYTRHDIPLLLYMTLFLWTILRYLDEGKPKWLYGMAAFFPLMYATKENAYIYTAIFVVLLALPFAWQVFRARWARPELLQILLIVLVVVLLLGAVFAISFRSGQVTIYKEEGSDRADEVHVIVPVWGRAALGLAVVLALGAVVVVYNGVGAETMRELRLFDVLMTLGTLTLPLGSALLINFVVGADMKTFYTALMAPASNSLPGPTLFGVVLAVLATLGLSIALGLWWNSARWPIIALIHYGIFFVTYSSFFTYGWGMFTGMIGGLAYWMAQQGVQRGTQPWYYYGLVGPLYEYLPLLFSIPAGVAAIGHALTARSKKQEAGSSGSAEQWIGGAAEQRISESESSVLSPQSSVLSPQSSVLSPQSSALVNRLFPLFLLAWALLSWVAYAYAGEKMPWLFVHIAFPHLLLAAWGLGRWLEDVTWDDLIARRGWVLPVALFFLWRALAAYLGATADIREAFFGEEGIKMTLERLQPLGTVSGVFSGVLLFGGLTFWAADALGWRRAWKLTLLTITGIIAGFTVRTMIMLNYINAELPTEYMVYAHATPDVKVALRQIEGVSWRLTGTPHNVQVAFDWDIAWPFMWYMDTQYPNHYTLPDPIDAERLLNSPVILVGRDKWAEVETIAGDAYEAFTYKSIWWPIEDYKDLTLERIQTALADPLRRAALMDIIRDRDYTAYARLRDPEAPFTFQTWPHRVEFRLYVRRDLSPEVWRYRLEANGVSDAPQTGTDATQDAFARIERALPATMRAALPGTAARGVAVAPDGTLYVSDTAQHCIWHLAADGAVRHYWGGYGAGEGQFNEPWGVAVDAQGNVYVADTWNHRVQKFDAQGQFLLSWGHFSQVQAYDLGGQGVFYGPRSIAVGPEGAIYVADTGNQRVQVFDAEGRFLTEFGGAGDALGRLNEPTGLAVDAGGQVFVADTWNQRVQVFTSDGIPLQEWTVPPWGGVGAEEPPGLAVRNGQVYGTDPLNGRVLTWTEAGAAAWALRDAGGLNFVSGVAATQDTLYVADAHTGEVRGYSLP
ncbi:MAG TPA: TIGR03663 family protein [Anaerolineae bacterium]|nr:TIGR03663 family protein [Anaerolineae bacterium]